MSSEERPRFQAIGRGQIAAIATTLERPMHNATFGAPTSLDSRIVDPGAMSVDAYLELYRRVGADHLWYSRLVMARDALAATLADPATVLRICLKDGVAHGILDMDFATPNTCEIKYFGVTPALQGTGAAKALMETAIAIAAERGVDRLWLHTNTIDHPRAMAFYRRFGFTPVHQAVEIADDPRLSGLLPRSAAPQVPIFD